MRVVGAIIRRRRGEYLLQLRDDRAPSYPDHWTLFGGVVDRFESPEAALRRELREEIGLYDKGIQSMRPFREYRQANGSVQTIFELEVTARLEDLVLREGAGMAFLREHELFTRPLAFNIYQVLCDHIDSAGDLAA